jgi:hypothetical protein
MTDMFRRFFNILGLVLRGLLDVVCLAVRGLTGVLYGVFCLVDLFLNGLLDIVRLLYHKIEI